MAATGGLVTTGAPGCVLWLLAMGSGDEMSLVASAYALFFVSSVGFVAGAGCGASMGAFRRQLRAGAVSGIVAWPVLVALVAFFILVRQSYWALVVSWAAWLRAPLHFAGVISFLACLDVSLERIQGCSAHASTPRTPFDRACSDLVT